MIEGNDINGNTQECQEGGEFAPSAGVYGNLYGNDIVKSITLASTFYRITGLSTGPLKETTIVSDTIVATYPGDYVVNASISFESDIKNKDYEFDLFLNGVQQNHIATARYVSNNDLGSASLCGIIPMVATDSIDIRVNCNASGTTITIKNFNFTLQGTAAGIENLTTTERLALSHEEGKLIFDIDLNNLYADDGTNWLKTISTSSIGGLDSVNIGTSSGVSGQNSRCIALGYAASHTNQGFSAISLGSFAAATNQQSYGIAIGAFAGQSTQGANSIAVGNEAGKVAQQGNSVSVGYRAGYTSQATNSVAVGTTAGQTSQKAGSIAIGYRAGLDNQDINSVAIGYEAADSAQKAGAIAIGYQAGHADQFNNSVSIGYQAGRDTQELSAVAIGFQAGEIGQSTHAIAIGSSAGQTTQGQYSVAVGDGAGNNSQEQFAVAVGINAGATNQGQFGIAVGSSAGWQNQGDNSIAIGNSAGNINQHDNSIVINASGSSLNTAATSQTLINPIREGGTSGATPGVMMQYNNATKELTQYNGGGQPLGIGSAGVVGTLVWSTTHLYVCTAASTWRRIELSTW